MRGRRISITCEECGVRDISKFGTLCSENLDNVNYNKSCTAYKKGQIIFHEDTRPFDNLFIDDFNNFPTDTLGKKHQRLIPLQHRENANTWPSILRTYRTNLVMTIFNQKTDFGIQKILLTVMNTCLSLATR